MKKILILSLLWAACSLKPEGPNKFANDQQLITIYDLQDRRNTRELLPYLKSKKESHRIAAALAFASIQDSVAIPYLNQMLQIDQDPMPRRAAALALGQIGNPKALTILKKAFDNELYPPNRRYILEAIGKCGDSTTLEIFENNQYKDSSLNLGWMYGVYRLSLKGFNSDKLKELVRPAINDTDPLVRQLASHYFYRLLRSEPDKDLVNQILSSTVYDDVKVRLSLLLPKELSETERIIQETYGRPWQSNYLKLNPYEKASAIYNLKSEYTSAKDFLFNKFVSDTIHPSIRNAAFEKVCEFYPTEKLAFIWDALETEDMALQSLAAIEIRKLDTAELANSIITTEQVLARLNEILPKLELPRQSETWIDIAKAIDHLGDKDYDGYKPVFNQPIDWDFVKTIPKNQRVKIETSKGEIILDLFVEEAPGTVSNFLKLVDCGFYDGLTFHRVVPQFVIQGGCPRGDGWGSLDWSQRSEFSNYQTYEEGTAGIASAGNDTEGVQFFITHCPTPHLDGRYTIFGRVSSGMDVVNSINVGDEIRQINRVE